MLHYTYIVDDYREFEHQLDYDYDLGDEYDLMDIAEESAQDYYNNHDGWENVWPCSFEIIINDESIGMFQVDSEPIPVFCAYKIKIDKD